MKKRPRFKANNISDPLAVAALDGMLDAVEKSVVDSAPSAEKYAPALRAVFGMLLGSAIGEKGAELKIDDGEPIKISKADAVVFAVKSLADLTRLEAGRFHQRRLQVNEEIMTRPKLPGSR